MATMTGGAGALRAASRDYSLSPISLNHFPRCSWPETMTTSKQDPSLFYRTHIFCCTNTRPPGHPRGCCSEKGSEKLRNYMKVRAKELGIVDTRVNAAGCLDRCELGPTMVIYPEGVWYGYRNTADIDEILETHEGRRPRPAADAAAG